MIALSNSNADVAALENDARVAILESLIKAVGRGAVGMNEVTALANAYQAITLTR